MIDNNSTSEWYEKLWERVERDIKWHSTRLKQNKEMLIEKWAYIYYKKIMNKYRFSNINALKEYLNFNLDQYCAYLDDDTLKDPKTLKEGETLFDYELKDKIRNFRKEFHEMIYDLEDFDPALEREKWRRQSKTKKVKNKIIAKLIDTLKMKMRRKK